MIAHAKSLGAQHRAARRRMRKRAGGGGRAVLAHIDRAEARYARKHAPAVEQLQRDADAVAREYGHELGAWAMTDGLLTSARCTSCTATVCLKGDGNGSNGDPLRWLREVCERPRFYAEKCARTWAVYDRERARYGPRALAKSKAGAEKVARALNDALAPGAAPVPDAVDVARARVDKARAALARAEQALHKLTGEMPAKPRLALVPDTTKEVPMTKAKSTTKDTTTKAARKPAAEPRASTGAQPLASGPELAADILAGEGRPMHVRVIGERVLAIDAARPEASRIYHGKTPLATISAQLTLSHGKGGRFIRIAPAVFALREWNAATRRKTPIMPEARAKTTAAA